MSDGAAPGGERLRRDVQGLRALAVVAVIGFHYHFAPFTNGYAGVDVFFVISGFVITTVLWRERDGSSRTNLVAFYARRVRRIVPAATATVVATVVGGWVLVGAAAALTSAHDALAAVFFFANFHFAQQATSYLSQGAPQPPLVHFWSLSIEEQFYFVWPGLFMALVAIGRRRRAVVAVALAVLAIAGFAWSIHATDVNQNAAYYSSFIRGGELALGALAATVAPWCARIPVALRRVTGWLALAAVVAAVTTVGNAGSFPGTWVLLATGATALVILCGPSAGPLDAGGVLGLAPLVWIGTVSYSLYLVHWPVYDLVALRLGREPSLAARLALVGVSVVLATASYYLLETPLRRARSLRRSPSRTFAIGGGFVATSVVTCVAVIATTTGAILPAPTPLTTRALDRALARAAVTRSLGHLVVPLSQMGGDVAYAGYDRGCLVAYDAATAFGNRPEDCTFGDTGATRTLVLLGDSNADMWLPAFSELGVTDHFRVVLIARASCQLEDLDLWNPALHAPGRSCTSFRRRALALVAQLRPFAVVLADYEYGVRWNYDDQPYSPGASAAALTRTVAALRRDTAHVVMLSMPPAQFADPVSCLETHADDVAACDSPRVCATAAAAHDAACQFAASTGRSWGYVATLPAAVRAGGGQYVNVTSLFCDATACPSVVDHEVVFFDLRHVSLHYTELVAPALGALLRRDDLAP